MIIEKEIVNKTKEWLKEEGIKFFTDLKEKHGEILAVYNEGGIPHPVHFREGMQVRNFLRGLELCKEWSAHELDDNWANLIEECIK